MTEKRFTIKTGYHGVHYISDHVNRKTYEFIGIKPQNLESLCDLLNGLMVE